MKNSSYANLNREVVKEIGLVALYYRWLWNTLESMDRAVPPLKSLKFWPKWWAFIYVLSAFVYCQTEEDSCVYYCTVWIIRERID